MNRNWKCFIYIVIIWQEKSVCNAIFDWHDAVEAVTYYGNIESIIIYCLEKLDKTVYKVCNDMQY